MIQEPRSTRWLAVLCCVLYALSVLLIHPALEMATNDDWSYSRSAQVFAETGKFVYNGWATAMLGWQLVLGGAAIRLFGFSFLTLRLTTFLVALVTVFLLHRCFVRSGLTGYNASVATAILALSPLFVPLSLSFMTDIPGLFVVAITFYCCLRAAQAATDTRCVTWICSAALLNSVGGTVRQIAWLGILALVPGTIWLLRKRRHVLLAGVPAVLLGIAFIFGCMRWFSAQPYALTEPLVQKGIGWSRAPGTVINLYFCVFEALGYLLPLLIACLPFWKHTGRPRKVFVVLAFLAIAAPLSVVVLHMHRGYRFLALGLGNYVTLHGVMDGTIILGDRPVVLPLSVRLAITLLVVLTVLVLLAGGSAKSNAHRLESGDRVELPWRTLLWLTLPFTIGYFFLLIPRAISGYVFDRYVLELIFFGTILMGRFLQEKVGRFPPATVAVAALIGLFSTTATHDAFAMLRGRVEAVHELRAAGIDSRLIDGGLEYNGWNELLISDHVNDRRIQSPKNIYKVPSNGYFDNKCIPQLGDLFPDITPVYGLSYSPSVCGGQSEFPPVTYRTWLPPRGVTTYIVRER